MADRTDPAESATRWLAGRSTRRSFLGRLGRAAVFVASGATVATLLAADEAEARVCGQSGVAGKCPTFDCDDGVWGWCWYATGCCAGGGLKKICDCCAPVNNVHGYCPSGTNVKCIVESCNTDPRVQVVTITRVPTDDAVAASAGALRARFAAGEAPPVWLVPADMVMHASVATPLATRVGATVALCARSALSAPLIAALQRLGTTKVMLVGPFDPAVGDALRRYGISVEARSVPADIATYSEQVALEIFADGARRAVCVEPTGTSAAAAPLAAGMAASKGYPLVVGVGLAARLASRNDGPRPTVTYLVGPEASTRAGEVPGGHPLRAATLPTLSAELLDLAVRVERANAAHIALVPDGALSAASGLVAGGPVLVHEPGGIASLHDVLLITRGGFRSIATLGAVGALTTDEYYRLQSVVNGFDAHLLIGVAGQGLPVIPQPVGERPIGLARRAGTAEPTVGGYWSSRTARIDD